MKFRQLSLTMLLLTGTLSLSARDVHGINGFYNWTAQQMQSEGNIFTFDGNGTKVPNWNHPDMQYMGDYAKFVMGLVSTTKTQINVGKGSSSTTQALSWRIGINFKPSEPIKITKNYPVVVWKFSLPENSIDSAYVTAFEQFKWISPYTGKDVWMNNAGAGGIYDIIKGIGSDGRMSLWSKYPNKMVQTVGYAANTLGLDSACAHGDWDAKKDILSDKGYLYNGYFNVKFNGITDTTTVFVRLPKTSGDRAEFIAITNYYCMADTSAQAAASKRLLDRVPYIQIPTQYFSFLCQADTLNADGTVKTQDQWPTVYLKWMKTFPNVKAAMDAISETNKWGDGTESAVKSQLNYALYYAEQILNGFKFRNSDPSTPDDPAYVAYQNAYNSANAVFNNTASTDADYQTAANALQAARVAFMKAADINSSLVYNYIKSATGSGAITIGNDDVTIGSVTGKALTIGSNDAAPALSFVATGNMVYGQRTYTLQNADGAVVQAADGTLLLVKGGTGSVFTFSERDTEGHNYDIKCGDYYYYIDGKGALACTKAIPDAASTNFDALSPYLFTITDALGDYTKNATESEKTGLSAGWEFNSTPVEDPGTHGTENGVEKTMSENSQTKMIDGWRMSRWRPCSRVNQETVKDSDGADIKCLVLTAAATYDSFDGATTGIVNDFSAPAAMRLDAGKEDPFYARDPNPRDSTLAYNFNPGINRYFAIKMKSTDDVTFNTLTFLGANTVTINATQITGMKGDVAYWDMLASGFSVGKKLYTSAFFSPEGFKSAKSKLYVDWIRTYSSISDIPEESFDKSATGIVNVNNSADAKFIVSGNTVSFFKGGEVYSIEGAMVYKTAGRGNAILNRGLYIVRTSNVVKKLLIK
jgi:hypothetical protein